MMYPYSRMSLAQVNTWYIHFSSCRNRPAHNQPRTWPSVWVCICFMTKSNLFAWDTMHPNLLTWIHTLLDHVSVTVEDSHKKAEDSPVKGSIDFNQTDSSSHDPFCKYTQLTESAQDNSTLKYSRWYVFSLLLTAEHSSQ